MECVWQLSLKPLTAIILHSSEYVDGSEVSGKDEGVYPTTTSCQENEKLIYVHAVNKVVYIVHKTEINKKECTHRKTGLQLILQHSTMCLGCARKMEAFFQHNEPLS